MERLTQALDEAREDGDDHCLLKFDYEEYVPILAVDEALVIAKKERNFW